MAGRGGKNQNSDGKHRGLPDPGAVDGGSLVKNEMKEAGQAVPKRTSAVVAKKQSGGVAPVLWQGGPGAW